MSTRKKNNTTRTSAKQGAAPNHQIETTGPKQLTSAQITELAGRLIDLPNCAREEVGVLFLLVEDITEHPHDAAHVESIARAILNRLFLYTREHGDAATCYSATLRKELTNSTV